MRLSCHKSSAKDLNYRLEASKAVEEPTKAAIPNGMMLHMGGCQNY